MVGFRLTSGIDAAKAAGVGRKPAGAVFACAVALAWAAAPAFGIAERDDTSGAAPKITGADSVVAQDTDCYRRYRWKPKLRAQKCAGVSFRHPMTNVSFQSKYVFGREVETKVYARLSKPSGQGPNPAVVLLHTCGGFGPHVYRDWSDFLTGLGYVVLSVDSYGARGARNCTELIKVWQTGRWHHDAKDKATAIDAYGALDYLAKLPFVDGNRVAVMGFSAGANAINNALIPGLVRESGGLDFKAAIALYGRCDRTWTKVSIPLMEIVGDKDTFHLNSCRNVGIYDRVDHHVLPGAYHAFDSVGARGYEKNGMLMQYSASATRKARELVKAFLAKHVVVTSKASTGDELASAGDRFDGAWQGSMRCGDCQNCAGPLKKNVKINIENGRFDMIPDSTYMGKGAIDDQGNVRIHPTHLSRFFSFDGTYDGEFFRLTGERGLRSCTIELSRAASPVGAGN